jgi:hypothetical protein
MNFTEEMLGEDYYSSEVRLLEPALPLSSSDPFVRFRIEAADSVYDLDRLNVYVNGVPLHGTSGLSLRSQHVRNLQRELEVPLSNGQNDIQMTVINDKGAESLAVISGRHRASGPFRRPETRNRR